MKDKNYFVVTSNIDDHFRRAGVPKERLFEIDRNFLKGESWQTSYQAYQDFIGKSHDKKLVLLELGVGAANQLIKAPFMNITRLEKNSTYITLNKGREVYIPDAISTK